MAEKMSKAPKTSTRKCYFRHERPPLNLPKSRFEISSFEYADFLIDGDIVEAFQ